MLLAHADTGVRNALLKRLPDLREPGQPALRAEDLARELGAIRRTGIAVVHRTDTADVLTTAMAAPVLDWRSRVVAAVGVIVHAHEAARMAGTLDARLRDAARRISHDLDLSNGALT